MNEILHKQYPKLGGDITSACQRLLDGTGAIGVIIVLYRGLKELTEIGRVRFEIKAADFRKLTEAILDDTYRESLATGNKACIMLAEATGAETVILLRMEKAGYIHITVNKPTEKELVAAMTFGLASDLDARN